MKHEYERTSALRQLQRRRRNHDLQASSFSDAISMGQDVRDRLLSLILKPGQPLTMHVGCAGPDWINIMMDIVLRYGEPIREWICMLEDAIYYTSKKGLQPGKLAELRDIAHTFLVPFLQYLDSSFCYGTSCQNKSQGERRRDLEVWTLSSPLGQKTLERCQSSYIPFSHTAETTDNLLPGDRLLNASIANTTSAICRVIIHVGFNIERLWLTHYGSNIDAPPTSTSYTTLFTSLRNTLQELESYLGWVSEDMSCTPGCSADEICYVPM